MAQKVEIVVTANTAQAETSIKRVGQRFEQTTPQVKGFQGAFTGATKAMAAFGIGGIGIAVVGRQIASAMGDAAKQQANLNVQLARLDPGTQKTFDDLKGSFSDLSQQFGVSTDDISLALATLLAVTKDSTLGMEELQAILGLVALGGESVESATQKVIAAERGNVATILELTGEYQSLADAYKLIAESGAEAVTVFDRLKLSFFEVKDASADLANEMANGTATMDDFKTVLRNVEDLAGRVTFGLLKDELNTLSDAIRQALRIWERLQSAFGRGGPSVPRAIPTPLNPFDPSQEGGDSLPGGRPGVVVPTPAPGPVPFPFPFARPGSRAAAGGVGTVLLGHGGIVREPTLAMIGESGPEAVVPLDRGSIGGTTIIIQGDAIIDDDQRMGKFVDEIVRRTEIVNRRGAR